MDFEFKPKIIRTVLNDFFSNLSRIAKNPSFIIKKFSIEVTIFDFSVNLIQLFY